MSEMSNKAIKYVELSKYALLITVGEENIPYVRPIGPFANDRLDVYFISSLGSEKVQHIKNHPAVTLYFQNGGNVDPYKTYKDYKSVIIFGKMSRVPEGREFDKAIGLMSRHDPKVEDWVISKNGAIFKVKADFFIYTDNSASPSRIKENIVF